MGLLFVTESQLSIGQMWINRAGTGMHIRYRDSHHTLGQPDVELPNPTQKIIIGSTSALSCLRHQAGWAEDTHSVSFFPCFSFCSTCSRVLCHTCCLLFGVSTPRCTSALHLLHPLHFWSDRWRDPNFSPEASLDIAMILWWAAAKLPIKLRLLWFSFVPLWTPLVLDVQRRLDFRAGLSPTLADVYLQCITLLCGTVEGEQGAMPTLPNLNSLGKLCSSSRSHSVDRVRVKRKSSVKRMSIIEDGHVAEVLYLIPKQYMEQMPYLNPNDYYLSERLNDVATGRTGEKMYLDPNFYSPISHYSHPSWLWLTVTSVSFNDDCLINEE